MNKIIISILASVGGIVLIIIGTLTVNFIVATNATSADVISLKQQLPELRSSFEKRLDNIAYEISQWRQGYQSDLNERRKADIEIERRILRLEKR